MLDETLGQLACRIPGATQVFHQYRMDFCCGGKQTLRDAARKGQVEPEEVERQLQAMLALGKTQHDWTKATNAELIAHILERYHARHREQLPELIRLALKVERVHADKADCPKGLAAHLETMLQELDSHMQKEEQVLFPMLERAPASGPAQGPLSVLRMEHDQHGLEVEKLDALTNNITPPSGACNTWRALYAGLTQFKEDLMQHIHLENNILFVDPTHKPVVH